MDDRLIFVCFKREKSEQGSRLIGMWPHDNRSFVLPDLRATHGVNLDEIVEYEPYLVKITGAVTKGNRETRFCQIIWRVYPRICYVKFAEDGPSCLLRSNGDTSHCNQYPFVPDFNMAHRVPMDRIELGRTYLVAFVRFHPEQYLRSGRILGDVSQCRQIEFAYQQAQENQTTMWAKKVASALHNRLTEETVSVVVDGIAFTCKAQHYGMRRERIPGASSYGYRVTGNVVITSNLPITNDHKSLVHTFTDFTYDGNLRDSLLQKAAS